MRRLITLQSLPDLARFALSAAKENAGRFALTQRFQLPGLPVRTHLVPGIMSNAIETALVTSQEEATGDGAPMQVFFAHPDIHPDFDPPQGIDEIHRPHLFASRLAEIGLRGDYFHDLFYWQFYDPAERIGIQMMARADAFPPWEPGAPLRAFLHWDYGARGLRLAHAGTLGRDGAGVLLAGGGGRGKSGTVVAGLLHGLDSVGDDYVLVDFRNGVTAHPLFATLKQDPAGFDRLRLRDRFSAPLPINWQGKHQFLIHDISARPIPASLPIKALLVPEITGGDKTIVTPLSRKEALLALAPSGIAQMPGDREGGFRFFSQLTRVLPCYRLSLGIAPEEIAAAIAEFIERTCNESQCDHAGIQSRDACGTGAPVSPAATR